MAGVADAANKVGGVANQAAKSQSAPLLISLGFRNGFSHELGGALFALVVAAVCEVFHVWKRKPECGEHFSPGI
jgi:hypothetical protein